MTMTQSGIEIDERDEAIRPADDLYRHINERWIARTPIPADKARYGSFHILAEEAEKAVRSIIEECQSAPAGSEAQKVGDLYSSFMDVDAVNARGAAPLTPLLNRIDEVESLAHFMSTLGELERDGIGSFVSMWVDNDPGDPSRYLVFLEQSGIGLPDESYFREDTFASIREAYRAHLERMFTLAGLTDPAASAARVYAVEERLASFHWDTVRCRDTHATYNLVGWDELALSLGPVAVPWRDALDVADQVFAEVVVRQPSFIEGARSILESADLESLTDWLRWQVIHGLAPYLSAEFVEENFAFYGTTLSGTPQIRDRWKRGVSFAEGALGEAVGKLYVERHYPPAAKAQMDILIHHLTEAYRESITNLEWMSDETKHRALEKLDKFTPKIGYPVKWRDYSTVDVAADDLIGNVFAVARFEFARELGKVGKPLDRDEWFMLPQTVNAYYNPGFNEIVFPAAILQYPFFVADRDTAANYGAIGAVIGHEIGHGFDDQGSEFDGDGRLSNWWSDVDRERFSERTRALIDQYNALEPQALPGHHVNGELTIGENIGDLGGLSIAWKAYMLSLDGAEPPIVDGMTGAERFFLSWAQTWRQSARDEEALRLLAIDPHSPPEFRCNQIVRNLDVFYDTFDVNADDPMWLDPSERVTIW
ncbi:MAG: peptidase M13 [Microbacteriaceae bacterium]|nr:peptidase M13 [Microbacteriaceae bacterium]